MSRVIPRVGEVPLKCAKCTELQRRWEKAINAGAASEATDYYVLLARHPEHGTSSTPERQAR